MTNTQNQTEQLLIPEQPIPQPKEPVVKIINQKVVASSLDIADYFGKRHDNVVRKISAIIQKAPEWGLLNFEEMQDTVLTNNEGTISRTFYLMTRAGFSIVAMSFTGDEALHFKIMYINRYEEMDAILRGEYLPELDAPSTVADREPLVKLVNEEAQFLLTPPPQSAKF